MMRAPAFALYKLGMRRTSHHSSTFAFLRSLSLSTIQTHNGIISRCKLARKKRLIQSKHDRRLGFALGSWSSSGKLLQDFPGSAEGVISMLCDLTTGNRLRG
jgi:hypothetical protein